MAQHAWIYGIDDDCFQRVAEKRFGIEEKAAKTDNPTHRYWHDCFCSVLAKGKIHGSFDHCFENAAYKARQLYIETEKTMKVEKALLSSAEKALAGKGEIEYGDFGLNVIAGHLLLKGNREANAVIEFGQKRIQTISEVIKEYGYDIYVENIPEKGVPTAFNNRPIVNPDLTKTSQLSLPLIHDVLYMHVIARHYPEYKKKINAIINYILSESYQRFPNGYGVGYYGTGFYSVGWSVTIPSFIDHELRQSTLFNLLHLSSYKAAHKTDWFRDMMAILELHKKTDATYEFPTNMIREKKNSYFVGGNHLGIVENRRLKKRNQMESTYWYHVIRQNMKDAV